MQKPVLAEAALQTDRTMAKRAALVAFGVAALALSAKVQIPFWPVPLTMQTFAVLAIGAAYGARLGVVTLLAYLALGAAGADVFAGNGETTGVAALFGATGGYLFGFAVAAGFMGVLARRGWDRSVATMALAMVFGNLVIYAFGLAGLALTYGLDQPLLEWGVYPFLLGDALKIGLAALILPLAWRAVGEARG